MKPVQYRIRIGRIVSDRPLGASREQFAESLRAELSTLLGGERSNRPGSVEAHMAPVILTLSEAKGKDLGRARRSE